jgi:hypothetical protein
MQTLIHADIFFFVTTVIVIALGLISIVILTYIAFIIADIREISRIARRESGEIAEDIAEIRGEIKKEIRNNSSVITSIFKVIKNLFNRRGRVNKK